MSLPITLHDGKTLNIKIRKSSRVRDLRIGVDVLGVYAIVPTNYNIKDLVDFIDKKKNWIASTSRYYEKLRLKYGEQNLRTDTISFLGKRYRLQIIRDTMTYTIKSENLKIITFHVTNKRKYKDDIRKWYQVETTKIIAKRLPSIASRLNIEYNQFFIKNKS